MDQWISDQRKMYVCHTNQISCCKGKWYVRRFDPDIVENGHIRGGSIYTLSLPRNFLWVRLRILWAGLIAISNWIHVISQRNIVFG